MKSRSPELLTAVLLFMTILMLVCVPAQLTADPGDTLYIEVNKSAVRATPKVWGKPVAKVSYGDALQEVERMGPWIKVKTSTNAEGYIHESAITKKKIVLEGSKAVQDVQADESDIVLAGKGFNEEIENNYRAEDQTLNYEAVDQVESLSVSGEEIEDFMKSGKLNE